MSSDSRNCLNCPDFSGAKRLEKSRILDVVTREALTTSGQTIP